MNNHRSLQCKYLGISMKCHKESGIYYSQLGRTVIKNYMECLGIDCNITEPSRCLRY